MVVPALMEINTYVCSGHPSEDPSIDETKQTGGKSIIGLKLVSYTLLLLPAYWRLKWVPFVR